MNTLLTALDQKIRASGQEYAEIYLTRSYAGSYVEEVRTLDDLRKFFTQIQDLTEITRKDMPDGAFSKGCKYYSAQVPSG